MKLKLKRGLAWRRVGEEVFVVDAASSKMHELNGPAAVIWEQLAAGRGEDAAVSAVTDAFDVDPADARRDCGKFIKELSASGLLDRAEPRV